MNVRITVRHIDIADDEKARAEQLFSKLTKFDSRLSRAEVVYDAEGPMKTVEGILYIDRDDPVVAKAKNPDSLTALDQVIEKLAKILRRRRSQVTDHRAVPKMVTEPELEEDLEEV